MITPTPRLWRRVASRRWFAVTLCVGASICSGCRSWAPCPIESVTGPLFACTALMMVSAYPAMLWLVHDASFSRLLAVELWLSFIYGSYSSAMVVFLTEIMPIDVRTSGFALAYSLATTIFGGFTPAISTYLIHATHNPAVRACGCPRPRCSVSSAPAPASEGHGVLEPKFRAR